MIRSDAAMHSSKHEIKYCNHLVISGIITSMLEKQEVYEMVAS